MGAFRADAPAESGAPRARAQSAQPHPSTPIPVQGPGVGEGVRTVLGETGLRVFPLILGGSEFGWNLGQPRSSAVLDRYVELGGNMVQTADSFAGGRSEYIIGQWLRGRGLRDSIVLATRVGGHADSPGLGSVNLVRAVEASLTRLGTDRIDVLYLDGQDTSANLEDTLATCEWLRDSGKVRFLAASRFSAERLVEARILVSAGYPRISVLETHYSLLNRGPFEGDLRLVTGAQGMAVTPTHSLEHGFLSGRHRTRARLGESARSAQLRSNLNRRGTRVLRAMDAVAAEHGVAVAAIALAWVLTQRGVAAPIVSAFQTEHVDELVQGVGVRLSRANLADLARAGE
ncbi:MAG: aldo/keto reductase [Microthrixaceae bacterium]|nr:aldo/keto reductase [Microthrixaceae bacterium]